MRGSNSRHHACARAPRHGAGLLRAFVAAESSAVNAQTYKKCFALRAQRLENVLLATLLEIDSKMAQPAVLIASVKSTCDSHVILSISSAHQSGF